MYCFQGHVNNPKSVSFFLLIYVSIHNLSFFSIFLSVNFGFKEATFYFYICYLPLQCKGTVFVFVQVKFHAKSPHLKEMHSKQEKVNPEVAFLTQKVGETSQIVMIW